MIHIDKPGAFITAPPDWTLDAACLTGTAQSEIVVTQAPFFWSDGAWQANVSVRRKDAPDEETPTQLVLRISPDTVRRWRDVGIDPFVEACAQLRDHLRTARAGNIGTLTLL